MQFCIKVVGLNRSYSANTKPILKKNYIQQKPANLRFAPIPPFNFLSSGPLKGQATNFQKNLYLKSYGLDSQLSYLDPCLIIDISKKKNDEFCQFNLFAGETH